MAGVSRIQTGETSKDLTALVVPGDEARKRECEPKSPKCQKLDSAAVAVDAWTNSSF